MAETSNSTPAPSATLLEHFDPGDWLNRFREAGGYWVFTGSGHLSIGWKLNREADPWGEVPRAVWHELSNDQAKLDAVKDLVSARAEGVTNHG